MYICSSALNSCAYNILALEHYCLRLWFPSVSSFQAWHYIFFLFLKKILSKHTPTWSHILPEDLIVSGDETTLTCSVLINRTHTHTHTHRVFYGTVLAVYESDAELAPILEIYTPYQRVTNWFFVSKPLLVAGLLGVSRTVPTVFNKELGWRNGCWKNLFDQAITYI